MDAGRGESWGVGLIHCWADDYALWCYGEKKTRASTQKGPEKAAQEWMTESLGGRRRQSDKGAREKLIEIIRLTNHLLKSDGFFIEFFNGSTEEWKEKNFAIKIIFPTNLISTPRERESLVSQFAQSALIITDLSRCLRKGKLLCQRIGVRLSTTSGPSFVHQSRADLEKCNKMLCQRHTGYKRLQRTRKEL